MEPNACISCGKVLTFQDGKDMTSCFCEHPPRRYRRVVCPLCEDGGSQFHKGGFRLYVKFNEEQRPYMAVLRCECKRYRDANPEGNDKPFDMSVHLYWNDLFPDEQFQFGDEYAAFNAGKSEIEQLYASDWLNMVKLPALMAQWHKDMGTEIPAPKPRIAPIVPVKELPAKVAEKLVEHWTEKEMQKEEAEPEKQAFDPNAKMENDGIPF